MNIMGNWIAANWASVLSVVIVLVTQIIVIARTIFTVAQHEKKLERLELMMEAHISSNTLHRTPDFEKRLEEFSSLLKEIKQDVGRLLKLKE